ncbi:SDR family oxidoreductase [uncultured Cloacibacillus sp.]|uniref:SDR family NAD(P)-dependent oxidoreductase n=1 Tax=uncultured Cloacibacillus sp. TaxID=889794 RepID=UPI002610C021|nr:SDR family oxidoreductase [uncultured Cloacibacillus sp.]
MADTPFTLEGRKILITGASSGIGKAAAKLASALGAQCVINGRDETRLNEALSELTGEGHKAIAMPLAPENCKELVIKAAALAGPLNGFVHCAGIEKTMPFRMTELTDLHEIMAINLDAFWEITRELVKKKNHEQGKLSVVGISSVTALYGSAGNSAYAASKGALISLIKSLASEYAGQKIRFNCVSPGYVETPMLDNIKRLYKTEEEFEQAIVEKHALGLGAPEDVANAVVYLLSNASRWVTGSVMNVNGGYLS